jgi:hypothetical protein
MQVLGFTSDEQDTIFRILASGKYVQILTEYGRTMMVNFMRFQFLMVASVKMTSFWDIALCNLVEVDRPFRDAYYLLQQRDESSPDDRDSKHH